MLSPVVDPSGHFLFAADSKDKVIVTFAIDSTTGVLTLTKSTVVANPAFVLDIVPAP